MKEIVLTMSEDALRRFCAFIELCPEITVVSMGDNNDSQDVIDRSFVTAIRELQGRNVFKTSADYTYIMKAANDGAVFQNLFFVTPDDFIDYMKTLGLEKTAGRSTLYHYINTIRGRYPEWSFDDADEISQTEILRRNNIVKQFLSAFFREKRRLLDSGLDK